MTHHIRFPMSTSLNHPYDDFDVNFDSFLPDAHCISILMFDG